MKSVFRILRGVCQWSLVVGCLLFGSGAVYGQANKLAGVYGSEFWLGFLRNNAVEPDNPTVKIRVFVVAENKVDVVVAAGGSTLGTISITNAAGGYGECELTAADVYPTKDEAQTATSKGVAIYAKDRKSKFSCYALIEAGMNEGTTRDATLLLPKDILAKEYFIQTYPTDTKSTEFVVVATEDETDVTIVPRCATSKSAAGSPLSVSLNKGQSYLVQSANSTSGTDRFDLSGSTICSNKPIAVFNGNEATMIPDDGSYSVNHTFEQCIPQTMWGTEFYVGLAGGTQNNNVQITAAYAGTIVTYARTNGGNQVVELGRGQSLATPIQLNDYNGTLRISSSKPILCYTYLSCGGDNTTEYIDPVTGDKIKYKWGNPTNAMVVPWSHRTKEMSFFTTEIENMTASAPRQYYVQVVAKKSDISSASGKIILDTYEIPASAFTDIGTEMAYANVALTSHGKHHLSTNGNGFVGFVHGMTSQSRAYQYTLGFDPPQYLDSLFIKDQENVMSPWSYGLPYIDEKGWYQRQLEDFPVGQERLDTAYVCDSTVLHISGQIAEQNSGDEIWWKIYLCDQKGVKKDKTHPVASFGPYAGSTTIPYQFIVDEQEDIPASQRTPFTYYSVDMERYKNHEMCPDLPPDADTLRTMVRVHRAYNDTIWRVICKNDTVHFFNDEVGHPGTKKITIFNFDKNDPANGYIQYAMGDQSWTREYKSVNGCDSTVTLKLYVCDSYYQKVDRTVCYMQVATKNNFAQVADLQFKYYTAQGEEKLRFTFDSIQNDWGKRSTARLNRDWIDSLKKNDTLMPIKTLHRSIVKNHMCADEVQTYIAKGAKYAGCPDTLDMNLTIYPQVYNPLNVNQQEWCTKGDDNAKWTWYRADGKRIIEEIKQDDPRFDADGIGKFARTYTYSSTDCPDCPTGGCVMEYDTLVLHIAKDRTQTVHICQNQSITYSYGGEGNKEIKKTYNGWDFAADKLYPNVAADHKEEITIGDSPVPEENCRYNSRLVLYVHPAYVYDAHLHTRIEYKDTTCVNVPKAWVGHEGHTIWDVKNRRRISADAIPVDQAGVFEYLDSIKTKTCTECSPEGCDSISRLTRIVGAESHQNKSFHLCWNGIVDFEWKGTKYYYYGRKYLEIEGVTLPANATLIGDEWLNTSCDGDKTWEKTFTGETRYHCDSTWTIRIHMDSTYVREQTFHICETEPYKFLDNAPVQLAARDEPYLFNDVVTSKWCKCDSGVTHHVYVHPAYLDLKDAADTTCQVKTAGAAYEWENHPKAGEPERWIWMINTKNNTRKKVMTDAIPVDVAGTFTLLDSLKTKTCTDCRNGVGCDSIWTKSLTIIPSYDLTYSRNLSSEGYWLWDDTLFLGSSGSVVPGGMTYKEKIVVPGEACYTHYQHHTTRDALGHSVGTKQCDSIVTWCIKVGKVFRDTAYAPVCANCEYKWLIYDATTGKSKTKIIANVPSAGESRFYYDSAKTVLGFDSIHVIELTGFPTKYNHESDEVCQGDEYIWTGHPGETNTLYVVTNGVANPMSASDFQMKISQQYGTYLIRDSLHTDTVFYNKKTSVFEPVSCDSIWELTLTVHPTYSAKYNPITVPVTICSNETAIWEHRLFVGYDYDEDAHPLAPPSASTYDSIVRIPASARTLFHDSIRPTVDGTQFGCDSVRFVDITIHPYKFNFIVDHIGDNNTTWSFGGKPTSTLPRVTREDSVPTASVKYDDSTRHEVKKFMLIDTLQTANGCDSIVWDSVYIHPSYKFTFDTLLCSNNDWSWRPESPNASKFAHINEKPSGYYYDSLKIEPYGIDSIFVLKLTIQPGAKHRFGMDICKNDTIIWDTEPIYYREHYDEIEHRYTTGSDCDSILILKPYFYEYYHFAGERLRDIEGYGSDSICRYDTLIWVSPGETTPHTAMLRGENGEVFDAVPTDTVGWITIYDSLHTTAPCHCDSTYMLTYYVKPAYRFYDTLTICSSDTIEWRGQTLFSDTATTIYTQDSYQTLSGSCDSVYYLTLYVNQAYDSTRYDTICGNEPTFVWEGHDLTSWFKLHEEDTLPRDTFLFTNYPTKGIAYEGPACDSVFRLYLNVRPILTEEWYDTICVSETYWLNDKPFTKTGIYTDTIETSYGCDSFAVVHLEVVPATKYLLEPLTVCADQNGFDIVFTYDDASGFMPKTVGIIYDSLAQACGFPKDSVVLPVMTGRSGSHDDDNPGGGGIPDDGGFPGGGFIGFSKRGQATMHVEIDMPQTEKTYMRPNVYSARIYFDNGTCDDPELQRVDFMFTVNYPDWLLEQHWMDAIGILNAEYNDGYTFSAYQWYKNDSLLVGETKPYLFVPDYLEVGAEYSVLLTRTDDSVRLFTCPIVAVQKTNPVTPTMPYVSVVPTYVVKDNPVVYIMCSQHGGEYKLYNPFGSLIQSGRFEPGEHNAFPVTLPAMSGMYLFELNQERGEQRTIKVIVN